MVCSLSIQTLSLTARVSSSLLNLPWTASIAMNLISDTECPLCWKCSYILAEWAFFSVPLTTALLCWPPLACNVWLVFPTLCSPHLAHSQFWNSFQNFHSLCPFWIFHKNMIMIISSNYIAAKASLKKEKPE